jgi:hypothetical protein
MHSPNSLKLADLRQHELRVDAAHVGLAAEARRGRRRRLVDWRDRITRRWRRRHAVTAPAPMRPLARSVPFDELATEFAAGGSAAVRGEVSQFVALVPLAAPRQPCCRSWSTTTSPTSLARAPSAGSWPRSPARCVAPPATDPASPTRRESTTRYGPNPETGGNRIWTH